MNYHGILTHINITQEQHFDTGQKKIEAHYNAFTRLVAGESGPVAKNGETESVLTRTSR